MKNKKYYTLEEVNEYLDELDVYYEKRKEKGKINREPFFLFGFECIHNFCLTQMGWVVSHEECCPYCVHSIIRHNGSKEDKIKFNKNHDLGDKYQIPITNKEVALNNKKIRKNKKNDPRRNFRVKRANKLARRKGEVVFEKITAKELNKSLNTIRTAGISISRRGKKNLWDDIFRYSSNPDEFIYVKGLKGMTFLPVISEDENIEEYLIEEIKRQNKVYKMNIPIPEVK